MLPFVDRIPPRATHLLDLARRRSTVVTFAAGFLFDVATITRIDAWTDLAIQLAYLAALTGLLVFQHRESLGAWVPPPRLARGWSYNVEALHFLYGGLLSAYVVLYFKSSTGAWPLVFFILLVGLMVLNEMPQLRRAGHRLRLGLYAFCLLSFLNYFVPILVGRMNTWVFLLSLVLAAGLTWLLAGRLTASYAGAASPGLSAAEGSRPSGLPARVDAGPIGLEGDRLDDARARVFAPAGAVIGVIGVLYVLQLIPPVPLSVQVQGIYHDVRRDGNHYVLTYERSLFRPWQRDSRPFRYRPGDRLHYAARVFAPTRFAHQVIVRWQRQDAEGGWTDTGDRIPLDVVGGRAEGFRGYAVKSNFEAGRWRVIVETADGRAIGRLTFGIEDDDGEGERRWRTVQW